MFLKKLYQHHKGWFIVVLLFAVMQLMLDIRQDVSISPFYHYGMYSKKISPQKIYIVTAVEVNGYRLQAAQFSPQQWDNIMLPVTMFQNEAAWNSNLWHKHISRLLHVTDSSSYTNNLSEAGFYKWYRQYLQDKLSERVDSIKIFNDIFVYNSTRFSKQPETYKHPQ